MIDHRQPILTYCRLKEADVTWLYGPFVSKPTVIMPRARILQQRPGVAEALKEIHPPKVSRDSLVRFHDVVQVVHEDGELDLQDLEVEISR